MIKPLSGDEPIALENAITHNLPSLIQEVPTPEEVSSIPGLSHLAPQFPRKRNWPTILLLGRDCINVHDQLQRVTSGDKNQIAIKTPLGWAVIGKPASSTRPLNNKPPSTTLKTSTTPVSTPKPTTNIKPTYAQITKQNRKSKSLNEDVDVDLPNT